MPWKALRNGYKRDIFGKCKRMWIAEQQRVLKFEADGVLGLMKE